MKRFISKYIADDGTVCKTEKQMLQINKRIDKLLLKDKLFQTFSFLQIRESNEWYYNNIAKRNVKGLRTMEYRLSHIK